MPKFLSCQGLISSFPFLISSFPFLISHFFVPTFSSTRLYICVYMCALRPHVQITCHSIPSAIPCSIPHSIPHSIPRSIPFHVPCFTAYPLCVCVCSVCVREGLAIHTHNTTPTHPHPPIHGPWIYSALTSSVLCCDLQAKMVCAPITANAFAVSYPIPVFAPVTTTTFPERSTVG